MSLELISHLLTNISLLVGAIGMVDTTVDIVVQIPSGFVGVVV